MLKKVPEKTCRKHGRKKSVVEGEHRNAQILPYTNAAQSTIKKIRFKKLPFKNAHKKKTVEGKNTAQNTAKKLLSKNKLSKKYQNAQKVNV